MGGVSVLYLLMINLMNILKDNHAVMNTVLIFILLAVFVLLSYITHIQQYTATYGLVYGEVKIQEFHWQKNFVNYR